MVRYSKITEKRKREIVLLRGSGCAYKLCTFCDYHLDRGEAEENYELNSAVLGRVTGEYRDLEVINSGSVFELDEKTLALIKEVSREKGIKTLHFESHFLYVDKIPALRREFGEFDVKMKLGLETFDYELREGVLKKGIRERDEQIICRHFNEANFLFGIAGQTKESMERDIQKGLNRFERICINLMCENTTAVSPDLVVKETFMKEIYPRYADDWRVDILTENTDFGVGA